MDARLQDGLGFGQKVAPALDHCRGNRYARNDAALPGAGNPFVIVVGFGFWILKPEYVRLLWTDPTGSKAFTYAIVSELVGILVIRRIANIRV